MEYKQYDTLHNHTEYEVKMTNIEDYLYNGENAKVIQMPIQEGFDRELHLNKLMEKIKPIMKENNFDSFSIIEITEQEYLYAIEEEL